MFWAVDERLFRSDQKSFHALVEVSVDEFTSYSSSGP